MVIFGEVKCQWSISRPLLGLILLQVFKFYGLCKGFLGAILYSNQIGNINALPIGKPEFVREGLRQPDGRNRAGYLFEEQGCIYPKFGKVSFCL